MVSNISPYMAPRGFLRTLVLNTDAYPGRVKNGQYKSYTVQDVCPTKSHSDKTFVLRG